MPFLSGRFGQTLCAVLCLESENLGFRAAFFARPFGSRHALYLFIRVRRSADFGRAESRGKVEDFVHETRDKSLFRPICCRHLPVSKASLLSASVADPLAPDFGKSRETVKAFSPVDVPPVTRVGVYPREYRTD